MLHMPLCLTWFDYDINSASPGNVSLEGTIAIQDYFSSILGNYIAVGSMEGVIELFDVDLVDQMEPLHTFGKKPKKKKAKSSKKSSKVRSSADHSTQSIASAVFVLRNRRKATMRR